MEVKKVSSIKHRMIVDAALYFATVGVRRFPQAALSLGAALCLRSARSKSLVRLPAPAGLTVYATTDIVDSVVRNMLHIFYFRDYEAFPGFEPKRDWVIVDAGAYVGLYTLRAAKVVGHRGRVLAIEPQPEAYNLLKLNVASNRLCNVSTLGACLADRWGVAELLVPPSPINATLYKEYAEAYGGPLRRVRVRAVPLDAVLSKLGRVDLLKLDIEGAELEVVEGSKRLQPSAVGRVIIEAHPPLTEPGELASLLEERGYSAAVYLPDEPLHQAFVYAF
ncbi:MAG: FkbM family methyltransferase [Thermofilaceae archaeon]